MQNFRALGAPPPDPHACSGWGLWPPVAGGFAPGPPNSPPLRISGYVPAFDTSQEESPE